MLYHSTLDLIGNTPLLRVHQIENKFQVKGELYCKLECYEPAGSIKDRAAYYMILDAIQNKKIKEGATIIEPTSGNTGIGLACLSNLYHLKCIIVMPKSMSIQRRKLLQDYNAELILIDGGMKECVQKAIELQATIPNSFIPSQFTNPSNPMAHEYTTALELERDLPDADIIVAGIGTGGTISGIGKYYKEHHKNVMIVGVEPASSPLITLNKVGPHKIQGIGANFIPFNFHREYVDQILTVTDEDAISYAREMVLEEGMLVGISSGAALAAGVSLLKKFPNKKVIVIMPDRGERYEWN